MNFYNNNNKKKTIIIKKNNNNNNNKKKHNNFLETLCSVNFYSNNITLYSSFVFKPHLYFRIFTTINITFT